MTEKNQPQVVEHRETSCYTYEVRLVVQVLAESKKEADDRLDENGGYVTQRAIALKDITPVYSGASESDEESSSSEKE